MLLLLLSFSLLSSSVVQCIECISNLQSYDTSNLTAVDFWTFPILSSQSSCYGVPPRDNTTSSRDCSLIISFCRPLRTDTVAESCAGKAVCVSAYDKFGLSNTNLGTFKDSKDFQEIRSGLLDFSYATGQEINGKKMQAYVRLHCDHNAAWLLPVGSSIGLVTDEYIKSVAFDDTRLVYQIDLAYRGACHAFHPFNPGNNDNNVAGTVILVILFIAIGAFLAYCVIGIVYNVRQGARGTEVLPNNRLWCHRIPTGAKYVCTCGGRCSGRASAGILPSASGTKTAYDDI